MPMPSADPDAAAVFFQQAVGGMPENLAAAYIRVFLGVRLNCAQCHDHPLSDWKQKDFWGVAAFFNMPQPTRSRESPPRKSRQCRRRRRSHCRCRRSSDGRRL